ncbi:MFS transporter [Phenylobacterium sp.]|uniref:spinster family MFS transporter n=1 Tax=Phenylobacterium sp. TaxID=1871053 RepID=UPI002737D52E|nr:MFS transporter [Phenylobacterium sp.]MDP3867540.1 MFS transporter [Phenylobacterium sp.]
MPRGDAEITGAARALAWPHPALAWFAVAALMVAYTSSFIDRQILTLLVEPIRRDLAISDTRFSLLAGIAFSLFYTLMGLPLARLSDRGSRRLIILVGIAVWSVMTVACGFASSFLGLFAARIGVGIGEATLSPAAYSLIADYFPPAQRARALAVYSMGPYIGAGLALIIGGKVIDLLSATPLTLPGLEGLAPWQMTFVLVGAPGLLIASLFLLVREPRRRGVAQTQRHAGLLAFLWSRRSTFVPIILGFSVFGIAGVSYMAWTPAVLIRQHGWSPGEVGMVYGAILLCLATPGVVVGGWLSDWLSARGRTDAPIRVAAFAMLAITPFAAVAPLLADTRLALSALGAACFGFGLVNGLPAAALQLVAPNQLRAQVTAAYFLIGNLISLGLGPTLVAGLSDTLLGGRIGVSLGLVSGVALLVAASLLGWSLVAFRASVADARAWQEEHA